MKKTLIGAMICILNLGAVCATLMTRNSSEITSHRELTATVARSVRSASRNNCDFVSRQRRATTVNLRTVRSPSIQGDKVRIQVRDCRDDNGNLTALSSWYTKDYPLQRMIVNFDNDFANGVSHPIEKLYANVNDLQFADRHGEIVVDDEFINTSRSFQHHTRNTGRYRNDDCNLRAKPFTEIYINVDGQRRVISKAKARLDTPFVNYTRTSTLPSFSILGSVNFGDRNCSVEVKNEYRRPDNSIFTQRTTISSSVRVSNVGYENDFDTGISFAKEKLYTIVNGRTINIKSGINYANSFLHHIRNTGCYKMNDFTLKARPYKETYISVNGRNKVLDTFLGKNTIAYTYVGNKRINRLDLQKYDSYSWRRTEILEDWQRPDGTIFTQRTEGGYKVKKERSAAPEQVPQQRVINQEPSHHGGVSNEFERFGHFVSNDCNIM